MAKGERSETTELTLLVADAMREDIRITAEALMPIPFMQEEISRSEYQRRFRALTQQQRLDEMRRLGTGKLLEIMSPGAM